MTATEIVNEGLVSVNAAADFSGLSRSELYNRMEAGELAYVKIGKRRLIPRAALVELAAKNLVVRGEQ